jgi:hypothetical protein
MTLQATGFLLSAVFAKAWLLLFGRTAIELALRLFYVALAAGAGVVRLDRLECAHRVRVSVRRAAGVDQLATGLRLEV